MYYSAIMQIQTGHERRGDTEARGDTDSVSMSRRTCVKLGKGDGVLETRYGAAADVRALPYETIPRVLTLLYQAIHARVPGGGTGSYEFSCELDGYKLSLFARKVPVPRV